jgi:hypothetical protein
MPLRRIACALAPLAVLAGCSTFTPGGASSGTIGTPPAAAPAPVWVPTGGTCSAGPAQSAVGQNATATVMEQARKRSGALMARIVRPGQVVTQDYNPERLNLQVDASGRITSLSCG